VGIPARERTLYEILESLPDGCTGEILAGTLHVNPRPSARHIRVGSKLGARLDSPFDSGDDGPGGWWILDEPEVHFIVDVELSVPDLAGWRRERMPKLPEDHRFHVVPDWICEIASPSTAGVDRTVKLPIYAAYGVRHVWLVDPVKRIIESLENVDGAWHAVGVAEGRIALRLPPFDAVAVASPWD